MFSLEELKKQKIWICWQYRLVKGQKKKVPLSCKGEPAGTDENYRHTWAAYEEAMKGKEALRFDGIGIVLPEGYFLLDRDDVDLDDPFMKDLLEQFRTYAEISVSGHGVHLLGYVDIAKIPKGVNGKGKPCVSKEYYVKNSRRNIELYIGGLTNRFATYSENAVNSLDIGDCTEAVLSLLENHMRRKKKRTAQGAGLERAGDEGEAFDIVCSLRKQRNGDKFITLYDKGDYSGYGSHSEADAALCALIAFRTGPEPEMIDTVFRGSALYREKWEREDYRTATIQYGIDACNGNFHRSVRGCPDFIRFREKGQPYVQIPALADHVRKSLRYLLVRNNGKEGMFIYVYRDGYYQLYSSDMMYGEIKQFIAEYDPELVRMSDVAAVYQHITTDLNYVRQDELDADELIINFQNGLLRVTEDSLELMPHSPDVYSTIRLPCRWTGKEEPSPVFDSYMRTLTDHDREVEELLYECMGVSISNIKAYRMKKALFMVGDGDTGKSQIKALTERILGRGNFIGIDMGGIEARFGTGAIYGTRLAGSSDMSFLTVDELKVFKAITGGDSVYAEFKGRQPFEFTYNGFLWFCMNRLPKFGGDNGKWVYDRIMIVRCPNVIPSEKQDRQLLDKMYRERDGIVYRAVLALQQVIRNGYRFSEPQCVLDEREEYIAENNTVIGFFEECMCERPGGKIEDSCTTGKVYDVYKAWCADNNNGYAKTAKEFRETLADHVGSTVQEMITHTKKGNFYKMYTVTDDAKEQYIRVYGGDFL